MAKKTQKLIKKFLLEINIPVFLLGVFLLVFLLRIPSLFEPFWYGDEMVYLTLGEALRRGLVWYRDIHDNKPPLLYLLATISGNVFWFRAILTVWSLATIYFFWRLTHVFFSKNEKLIKIAILAFALLSTLPLLEGNIANAEAFMVGPAIAAFYLLLKKGLTTKRVFAAGVLFSVSTLFKVPAIFDIGAILVFWLAGVGIGKVKDWQNLGKNILVLSLGIATPIALTLLYYFANGALTNYINAAFLQNIGYLSTWRATAQDVGFLERNAMLLIRAGILLVIVGILFWRRRGLSSGFLFASLWFLFSLFATLLSERPYPHYLIQVVPPLSLLIGIAFSGAVKERFLPIPLLAILAASLIFYKFGYYPVFSYYQNFVAWVAGAINKDQYFASFDKQTPRNYQVANYIVRHTGKTDPVFVWGNDTAIYALSRRLPPSRLITAYHVRDFNGWMETITTIKTTPPRYIVITDGPEFPELSSYIRENYVLVQKVGDSQIFRSLPSSIKGKVYP